MNWDHVIRGGEIITPASRYNTNIYIKDGKIAAITDEELPGEAKENTDASGLQVLPGLIDTHVHSRDGGATYKEDFFHSTQAAAAGGITTVFEMPNTNPPVNNSENFNNQVKNLKNKAHVNFGLWGICLGDLNIGDLQNLHHAGVIGFKYFWGYAVDENTYQLIYNYTDDMVDVIPPCDDGEVYAMLKEVAKTGQTFAIHAENSELINHLTEEMKKTGKSDYQTVLTSRPHLAEVLTIQTGISLAKATGARLHVLHISTAEGVKLIREAQAEGYPITGETCPHFLFLTEDDFEEVGNFMKVYPLVKSKSDQNALWEGISDGTITFVCSDHAPHTAEEKIEGDLWSIPSGMCGVETLAPLMLDAVSEKKITLEKLVSLLAENPAKQFGVFPQKGIIQVGSDADLTIVDMEKEFTIQNKDLHSKSKVSAYDHFNIKGKPVQTIVNGATIMKNGKVNSGVNGQLVTPKG